MLHGLIAAYLAAGGTVTICHPGVARSRIRWFCTSHPTHNLPISLGVVGRW